MATQVKENEIEGKYYRWNLHSCKDFKEKKEEFLPKGKYDISCIDDNSAIFSPVLSSGAVSSKHHYLVVKSGIFIW